MGIFMRKNKTLFTTILLLLAGPSSLHSMEEEAKKTAICLVGDDGKEFSVDRSAAERSELIKNLLSDCSTQEQKVPVCADSDSLEKITQALKKLATVHHDPETREYNEILETQVKNFLVGPTIDDNLKTLETLNRFNISNLTSLPIDEIARQLYESKDLNYVASQLEKIHTTLKDLKPQLRNQLQQSNKSLFFHLFFTYLQSSAGPPLSNSSVEDACSVKINSDQKQALIRYKNDCIKIGNFNNTENPITKQFFLSPPIVEHVFGKNRQHGLSDGTHRLAAVELSPNGQYLFGSTASNDGYLLHLTGSTISILKHFYFNSRVNSAAFSQDNSILLLGTECHIHLYYMKDLSDALIISGEYLNSYKTMHMLGAATGIHSIAITPDNKYLFAGYLSIDDECLGECLGVVEMVELLKANDNTQLFNKKVLKTPSSTITFIAISDNAQVALTKSAQGGVCLWDLTKDVTELAPTTELAKEGTSESITSLALDRDGKIALTYCSSSQKLILWNLENLAKCVPSFTIQMPKDSFVKNVAFDKDNLPVALVSNNGRPRWYSFSDFMAKFSLPELILFTKIEQCKADNKLADINKCTYFKELYAKLSLDIKTLVDHYFGIGK